MATAVNELMLRHAGVYTTWMYVAEPKNNRPQRGFRRTDIATLSQLILEISNEYNNNKKEFGKKAVFRSCLNKVISQKSYNQKDRNLYTSILMTYFRWRQSRFKNEYEKKRVYLERLWLFMELTK